MRLGEKQVLTIVNKVNFGIYLAESKDSKNKVLLPARQVPEGVDIGDKLEVFIYKDSKDRLIATTNEPKITMDKFAALKVAAINNVGAFLDWGLEKDLLLPFKEQLRPLNVGDEILVSLYADKSERLCATMEGIYHLLDTDSPYQKDDIVRGRIYEFSKNFGTFVAVDDRYSARIPAFEDTSKLKIGDVIEARVSSVKEDGKLDLTLRSEIRVQIKTDAQNVLKLIESYGGILPFNDKASPEIIQKEAHMSKNAFKRAVGHLYKEHIIEFTEKSIKLL